ncbi:MAG: NUDIX domain-containing protein [Lentisphaeria bacterium]|nr:NUDIX domain-containing protein [Lentisphaeria bacterium]
MLNEDHYKRLVQSSVTLFVHCGDDYLFLKRGADKRVDPGLLNGVGGRVEPGENYLSAAIRECIEETGYEPALDQIEFSGVVQITGGYNEDWVMCFFKIEVPHKNIPIGTDTVDGELIWLHKDAVLSSGYELVDDLNYCFEDIVKSDKTIFANYHVDDSEKITGFCREDLVR